jgi:hypothetical protein
MNIGEKTGNGLNFKAASDPVISPSSINFGKAAAISAGTILQSGSSGRNLKIVTAEDIAGMIYPFRILIWGMPNTGKTHFLMTMPEPVCIIDTEGRYGLLVKKFRVCKDCEHEWMTGEVDPKTRKPVGGSICPACKSKNVRYKNIMGIRCLSSEDARNAANLFIQILKEHFDKTGKVGTIGVDNISKVWDGVQTEYSQEKYGSMPNVTMDPMSDYKFINPKHNEQFRDKILGTMFNVVLIATQRAVYDKEDRYKIVSTASDGQKHNPFAVDWTVQNMEGEQQMTDGRTMGNGIYSSYITKNSLIAGKIPPIQFLDYKKLVKIRESLLLECGVTEILEPEPVKEEQIPATPSGAPA